MRQKPKIRIKPTGLKLTMDARGQIRSATVSFKCPYCGETHIHGLLTGYRCPHCDPNDAEIKVPHDYFLDCDKFIAEVEVQAP